MALVFYKSPEEPAQCAFEMRAPGGDKELALQRTRDWNGNASCAREKLASTRHLIFMPEPYPFNPWFVRVFQTIG
jgi:hypothetical protein